MSWLRLTLFGLTLYFIFGCVNTDSQKPNYQFGDKSSLDAIR